MILLQYGTIKGDSQITGYTDWIAVDSVSWGCGRGISSAVGGNDRDPSTPSFSEVTITKSTDLGSTLLFAEAAYGEAIDKCTLLWIQTGGKDSNVQVYQKLELTNPMISGYSQSSGGDKPSESLAINFTKIVMNYTQFKQGKDEVKADPKGFNIETGKAEAT